MTCGGAYGYHSWEVKIGQLTKAVLLVYELSALLAVVPLTRLQRSLVLLVLSGPLVWMIKFSVFSLIFHAFRPIAYIRQLVYAGVLVTGLYHTGVAITNGVICGPHGGKDRASYMAGMAGHNCGDPSGIIQVLSVTSGAVNLLSDVYLLVLPVPPISKLKLPSKRKTGILLIFMTGTM